MLAKMVTILAHVCEARVVAVWSCEFGQLHLRHSSGLGQSLFNLGHVVWNDMRADLQDGRTVVEQGAVFVPLQSSRQDLVGMVMLDTALPDNGPRRAYVDDQLRLVAKHIQLPEPPPEPDAVVVPTSSLEAKNGQIAALKLIYAALLTRHGWNVSLVANLLGMPRPTLVARLRTLGLRRPRPSPKARPSKARATDPADAARQLLWPRTVGTAASRRQRRS